MRLTTVTPDCLYAWLDWPTDPSITSLESSFLIAHSHSSTVLTHLKKTWVTLLLIYQTQLSSDLLGCWNDSKTIEVCGCYSITHINLPRILDWPVLTWGSSTKHRNNTCSKKIALRLKIPLTTPHSRASTIGRTYAFTYKTNNHALSNHHI